LVPHFLKRAGGSPEMRIEHADGWEVTHFFISDPDEEKTPSWSLSRLGRLPQCFLLMRRFLETWHPQVIHSFTLFPISLPSALIARQLRVPLVVGVRGNDITANMFRPDALASIHTVLDNAAIVAPVASDLASYCVAVRPSVAKRIRLVINGVQPFDKSRCRFANLDKRSVQFGTVCMTKAKKNLDVLLRAFRRLHHAHRRTQLVIVGPMQERDCEFIRGLGLGGAIGLTGTLERSEALSVMAGFDVFVIPSAFEGCANTMQEAMYLGLPVIASATGGALDLLAHEKTGMLFDPLDEDALLGCLEKCLSMSTRNCLAKAARRAVRTPAQEVAEWEEIYKNVLRKKLF
jgi:glycosyltransferase involved in cell wall biosynthesis